MHRRDQFHVDLQLSEGVLAFSGSLVISYDEIGCAQRSNSRQSLRPPFGVVSQDDEPGIGRSLMSRDRFDRCSLGRLAHP